IYEDTAIFFSSDNGPSSEARNWLDGTEDFYYGGSSGIFSGHKGSLFEGGIRMPAILSYPSSIKPNTVYHGVGMMMDIMPTFLTLAKTPLDNETSRMNGRDILSMIPENKSPHKQIFWELDGQLAVRYGKWKLVI